MLETIFAGLSGGLTGLAGGLLQTGLDFFKQREDNKHALKMAELDLKSQEMEFQHQVQVESMIAEKEIAVAEAKALAESYSADSASYSKGSANWLMFIVDFVRGLVRPALTIYLIYMCASILAALEGQQNTIANLDPQSQHELYESIIDQILFMANMAVSWWFGSRSKYKQK